MSGWNGWKVLKDSWRNYSQKDQKASLHENQQNRWWRSGKTNPETNLVILNSARWIPCRTAKLMQIQQENQAQKKTIWNQLWTGLFSDSETNPVQSWLSRTKVALPLVSSWSRWWARSRWWKPCRVSRGVVECHGNRRKSGEIAREISGNPPCESFLILWNWRGSSFTNRKNGHIGHIFLVPGFAHRSFTIFISLSLISFWSFRAFGALSGSPLPAARRHPRECLFRRRLSPAGRVTHFVPAWIILTHLEPSFAIWFCYGFAMVLLWFCYGFAWTQDDSLLKRNKAGVRSWILAASNATNLLAQAQQILRSALCSSLLLLF